MNDKVQHAIMDMLGDCECHFETLASRDGAIAIGFASRVKTLCLVAGLEAYATRWIGLITRAQRHLDEETSLFSMDTTVVEEIPLLPSDECRDDDPAYVLTAEDHEYIRALDDL